MAHFNPSLDMEYMESMRELSAAHYAENQRSEESREEVRRFFVNIECGNIWDVEKAISSELVEVDVRDEHGYTAIYTAASNGRDSLIELFVKLGSKHIDTKCGGATPLRAAVGNGYASTVETLVRLGREDINSPGICGWTHMHAAAYHESVVKTLLRMGNNQLDACNSGGNPPIQHLCVVHLPSLRTFLLMGADYSRFKTSFQVRKELETLKREGFEECAFQERYPVYFEQSLVSRLLFEIERSFYLSMKRVIHIEKKLN